MSAKPWVVVAVMAMMCLMPYQSVDLTNLSEDYVKSESSGNSHEILIVGNSYVASNSLHNLVDGVMNDASITSNVSALTGGGMRLSQHWNNVASAGHQWNTTLNNGNWDWVVLQDQSQIPGFPRSQAEWGASKDGAVELAEVIEDNGGETVLMMTWGRRDGDSNNAWRFPDFSTMQDELESGYLDYRDNISANGGNAWVAPVGLAFEYIHDKIVAEGGTPTNSGNTFYNLYTNDGSHPSLSGSYLAAVVIYATITGNDPVGLSHSTSLSNGLVLELQQAAAATVFNETSHLNYPWQKSGQSVVYPPAFGDSSIMVGEGSVHILANYTIGIWNDNNFTTYNLLNMTRIADYPCNQIKDMTNLELNHPLIVSRDRNTIACENSVYRINSNGELNIFKSGVFRSNVFAEEQNITVHTSYGNGCRWSTASSTHTITVNNSTIFTQFHCGNRNIRHLVPTNDSSDAVIFLDSPADPDSGGPLGESQAFNKSGGMGNCGGGDFSSNQGVLSRVNTGQNYQICTISADGTKIFDLGTNINPVDYRAHENCRVAVTTSHLHSGSIIESIAGATSIDCLEQDKLVIIRNGYLEYWWKDSDGDGVNDLDDIYPVDGSQQYDSDLDGYGDNGIGTNPDGCPYLPGNSTADKLGCPDSDGDTWSDGRDIFPFDKTQWNDTDLDGYGDEITGLRGDYCPHEYGTSTYNNTLGCPDTDNDGWANIDDKFPLDSSQWLDEDNDGFGNELNGFEGDSCPSEPGTSYIDKYGCIDSDGDGWSDDGDALPDNPTQWSDRDGDGFGDNESGLEPDIFPTDGTQWKDSDGDGYGDNEFGNQGDWFPNDPEEWKDSDGDNLGDNSDMFPFDPTQTEDRDGDGMGDNPMGIGADKFPDDPTQWGDIDGDGYGDNSTGNNPDAFPTDATQWSDMDGD